MGTIASRLRGRLQEHPDLKDVQEFFERITGKEDGTEPLYATTYSTVARYFSGDVASPPLGFLEVAGDVLGCPAGYLAFGEDPRPLEEIAKERETWKNRLGDAAAYAPPAVIEDDREEMRRILGANPLFYMLVGVPPSAVIRIQELAYKRERSLGGLATELLTKAIEAEERRGA